METRAVCKETRCKSTRRPDKEKSRLTLMVDAANLCQLGCVYCYYGNKGKRKMNVDRVYTAIVNFIFAFKPEVQFVSLHYMGGEPLLAWEEILQLNALVKEFCRTRESEFSWSMTSNLIALDQSKTDWMIADKAGIHCSFDGPADIHNRNRPYAGGRPSFDDVVKNMPLALSISPMDTARVTVMPRDADRLPEIAAVALDRGFGSVGIFPANGEEWNDQAIKRWSAAINESFRMFPGDGRKNKIRTIVREPRPEAGGKFSYCGAGFGLWAFNVDGELHFCHHFTNSPEYAIIDASTASVEQIKHALAEVKTAPWGRQEIPGSCRSCPALLHCNGGCWADNLFANGNSVLPSEADCRLRIATTAAIGDFFIREPIHDSALSSAETCGRCYNCYSCQRCNDCEHCERCDYSCDRCDTCQTCDLCERNQYSLSSSKAHSPLLVENRLFAKLPLLAPSQSQNEAFMASSCRHCDDCERCDQCESCDTCQGCEFCDNSCDVCLSCQSCVDCQHCQVGQGGCGNSCEHSCRYRCDDSCVASCEIWSQ